MDNGIVGALIGAGVALLCMWATSRATRKRDRDHLSVEFLTTYLEDIHGHYASGLAGLRRTGNSQQQYDARLVGNWFETFAALIIMEHANGKVVEDAGLKGQMAEYWNVALGEMANGGLINPQESWPNLGRFVT